jgi:hypothetical protein
MRRAERAADLRKPTVAVTSADVGLRSPGSPSGIGVAVRRIWATSTTARPYSHRVQRAPWNGETPTAEPQNAAHGNDHMSNAPRAHVEYDLLELADDVSVASYSLFATRLCTPSKWASSLVDELGLAATVCSPCLFGRHFVSSDCGEWLDASPPANDCRGTGKSAHRKTCHSAVGQREATGTKYTCRAHAPATQVTDARDR